MSHVRQQIRDYIAAAITPGTAYGTNVFKMRSFPLSETVGSAVCVYTTGASYERSTMGRDVASRTYDAVQTVMIEAFVAAASETAFDGVDAVAAELEAAVLADPTLGGLAKDVLLVSAEQDMNTEGGKAVATIALEIQVRYRFAPGSPEVSIP